MPQPGGAQTLLFRAYRGLTTLALPIAWPLVSRKLGRHGVPPERRRERLGHATLPRPPGQLIWFHAASVGESLSVLTLITRMGERLPDAEFLITSGTATSAELIAKRMPPRSRHQFAPLDASGPVSRFLAHWKPDAAIFVESELWPLMLVRSRASGARLALLNARLSDTSVQGWKKRPKTAHYLMNQFSAILTQNDKNAANMIAMGAAPDRVYPGSNLKSTSAPLPVDSDTLSLVKTALHQRPTWVASSTHEGEEQVVLTAHGLLLQDHPDLCLILAPRHPERGDAVRTLIEKAGLTVAQRSRGGLPGSNTQVYLADTLGEVGTWYALCPRVFLGGSLLPVGGHNPFEPAQAGAAVLTGPGVSNFAETYRKMIEVGAAQEVITAQDMTKALNRWLCQPETLDSARSAARAFVRSQAAQLDQIIDRLAFALILDP
jgi:3-deoxy-D-manno-octulosonic-acid transferase